MVVLVVGDHHNGLGEEGDPHDHPTAMQLPPQQTCTPGALKLGVGPVDGGVGIQATALVAEHSSATSGRGCCCGRDSVLFRVALGRHRRLVADGYLFAVRAHDVCVT